MFELILEWVAEHILSFLSRRTYSGQWRWSHLLPVAFAAFLVVCWLGGHWDSAGLTVIGVLGATFTGMTNLIVCIPRWIGEKEDFESYLATFRGKKGKPEKNTASDKVET